MRALFCEISLLSLTGGVATLEVRDPSYGNVVLGRRDQIAEIFQRVVGAAVKVEIDRSNDPEPSQSQGPIDDAINEDPIVQQAKDLFGGTVVRVENDTAAAEPQ